MHFFTNFWQILQLRGLRFRATYGQLFFELNYTAFGYFFVRSDTLETDVLEIYSILRGRRRKVNPKYIFHGPSGLEKFAKNGFESSFIYIPVTYFELILMRFIIKICLFL